ncbi:hypothetical protein H9P43_003101 [Blastocladiella emersonii ATCC 22665]|nr:hypothetical protein H9P43_003101 [Blastocladiella emersonii ATCC 22665]
MPSRNNIALSRVPTPYPDDKPPLFSRLFGRKPAAVQRPTATDLNGASASSSSTPAEAPPRPPKALKFSRTLSIPRLMRSPTPYPDPVDPAAASRKRKLSVSSLFSSLGRDSSTKDRDPATRASRKRLARFNLARSPTPYPEDARTERAWWGGKKNKNKAAKAKGKATVSRTGSTTSSATGTGRPEIVILRKEPLHRNQSAMSAGSAAAAASTVPQPPAAAVQAQTPPEQPAADVKSTDAEAAAPAAAVAASTPEKQPLAANPSPKAKLIQFPSEPALSASAASSSTALGRASSTSAVGSASSSSRPSYLGRRITIVEPDLQGISRKKSAAVRRSAAGAPDSALDMSKSNADLSAEEEDDGSEWIDIDDPLDSFSFADVEDDEDDDESLATPPPASIVRPLPPLPHPAPLAVWYACLYLAWYRAGLLALRKIEHRAQLDLAAATPLPPSPAVANFPNPRPRRLAPAASTSTLGFAASVSAPQPATIARAPPVVPSKYHFSASETDESEEAETDGDESSAAVLPPPGAGSPERGYRRRLRNRLRASGASGKRAILSQSLAAVLAPGTPGLGRGKRAAAAAAAVPGGGGVSGGVQKPSKRGRKLRLPIPASFRLAAAATSSTTSVAAAAAEPAAPSLAARRADLFDTPTAAGGADGEQHPHTAMHPIPGLCVPGSDPATCAAFQQLMLDLDVAPSTPRLVDPTTPPAPKHASLALEFLAFDVNGNPVLARRRSRAHRTVVRKGSLQRVGSGNSSGSARRGRGSGLHIVTSGSGVARSASSSSSLTSDATAKQVPPANDRRTTVASQLSRGSSVASSLPHTVDSGYRSGAQSHGHTTPATPATTSVPPTPTLGSPPPTQQHFQHRHTPSSVGSLRHHPAAGVPVTPLAPPQHLVFHVSYAEWVRDWKPVVRETPFDEALELGFRVCGARGIKEVVEVACSPATVYEEEGGGGFEAAWFENDTDDEEAGVEVPLTRGAPLVVEDEDADDTALAKMRHRISTLSVALRHPVGSLSLKRRRGSLSSDKRDAILANAVGVIGIVEPPPPTPVLAEADEARTSYGSLSRLSLSRAFGKGGRSTPSLHRLDENAPAPAPVTSSMPALPTIMDPAVLASTSSLPLASDTARRLKRQSGVSSKRASTAASSLRDRLSQVFRPAAQRDAEAEEAAEEEGDVPLSQALDRWLVHYDSIGRSHQPVAPAAERDEEVPLLLDGETAAAAAPTPRSRPVSVAFSTTAAAAPSPVLSFVNSPLQHYHASAFPPAEPQPRPRPATLTQRTRRTWQTLRSSFLLTGNSASEELPRGGRPIKRGKKPRAPIPAEMRRSVVCADDVNVWTIRVALTPSLCH